MLLSMTQVYTLYANVLKDVGMKVLETGKYLCSKAGSMKCNNDNMCNLEDVGRGMNRKA